MLEGITQTATQLAHVTAGKVGANASPDATPFSSVIRREQPSAPAPTAGGPLSQQAARPAQQATEAGEPGVAERSLRRIVGNQRRIERSMRRAMRGADFSPQELLALQMQVQKYSVEVEAVSRVVDRVAGAVKTTMQTQL